MRFKNLFPSIVCKDGATASVQASETHYSTPRDNDGPYTHIEVGFPTGAIPESWNDYDDGNGDIFGYMPIELVEEFITMHGGIDFLRTFNKPKP